MDLVTEIIKTATESYNKGDLKAAIEGFAQVVKLLKETAKVAGGTSQQTSPQT